MGDEGRIAQWARRKIDLKKMRSVKSILRRYDLHTVCESARCPNQSECFDRGQATFMIMGDICTRNCSFCNIKSGVPFPLDAEEPKRVAEAARFLGLKHVVVTSVTRDDLDDQGASHYAATVDYLKRVDCVETTEVLVSDLGGKKDALMVVLKAKPDVFNHNVETVPSLYAKIRPQADYIRSLKILQWATDTRIAKIVKSGFMVGFGERVEEVEELLDDLKDTGCSVVTIGQYLRPSTRNISVQEYVPLERFKQYEEFGERIGMEVIASPFVRSSYKADILVHRREVCRPFEIRSENDHMC